MNDLPSPSIEQALAALAELQQRTKNRSELYLLRFWCRDSLLVYWVIRGQVPHSFLLSYN